MKKIALIAIATIAFGMANAQHVSPISFNLVEYNLDTLRAQFPDAANYYVEINNLKDRIATDANALKVVEKELKDEKAHLKNLNTFVKERTKQLGALEKLYTTEIKQLEAYQKTLNNQKKNVQNTTKIEQQSRMDFIQNMNDRADNATIALNDCNARLAKIQAEREIMKEVVINVAGYDNEIQHKELNFKNMSAQNKEQAGIIKAEEKLAKAAAKGK